MAKTFEPAMYYEYFEFILENEDGVISTTDLIKYLANLNQFAKSVNHTLNSQYGVATYGAVIGNTSECIFR